MTKNKMHYQNADGLIYVSTVDNNTWAPGVYGQKEVQ